MAVAAAQTSNNNNHNNNNNTHQMSTQSTHNHNWIATLKQEKHQLMQQLHSVQSKCHKVQEDVPFLCHMNESLESNQVTLQQHLAQAEQGWADVMEHYQHVVIPPLQEHVTHLMLQLEALESQISAATAAAAASMASLPSSCHAKKPPGKSKG